MDLLFVAIIIATLIPFYPSNHWFFHGFAFFRIQIMYAGLGFLGTYVVMNQMQLLPDQPNTLIFLTFISCLCYQVWKIYPYTLLGKKHSKDCKDCVEQDTISIISVNVLQSNENKDGLVEIIKSYKPDVFITLESDHKWEKALNVLEVDYPYSLKIPKDNLYGMHIYSKLELINKEELYLVDQAFPSIRTKIRLRNGKKIALFSLHPPPPSPTEKETSTKRDGELMIAGNLINMINEPTVVCGDLNDVAWSRTTSLFLKQTGLLDPRKGRGFFPSFHTSFFLFRTPIDHLFHSHHFCIRNIERLPRFGSDHFGMFYQLAFCHDQEVKQKIRLDEQERRETSEIIKKTF